MQRLTPDDFERECAEYDGAVLATPDIDHFCSSSAWILPAHDHLMPRRTAWFFRDAGTYVVLAQRQHTTGLRTLEPLESSWGLACPIIGTDTRQEAALVDAVLREYAAEWDLALFSGITPSSSLFQQLVPTLGGHYRLGVGQTTRRYVANVRDGLDGYLAGRSHGFRKKLAQADRRARLAGLTFERCSPSTAASTAAAYARILDVEARSWKGRDGVGINQGPLQAFYHAMTHRLVRRHALRLLFAQHDGRDVAYILGGTLERTYRGLQFSYDEAYAPLSLGSLCQRQQIEELCTEGFVNYDLGTEIAYKERWADRTFDTITLTVRPLRH